MHPADEPRLPTALVTHAACLEHLTGGRHPESVRRLKAVLSRLDRADFGARLLRMDAVPAPRAALELVHAPVYLDALQAQCASGHFFRADEDTIASPGTWNAARHAAGAVLTAIDAVLAGRAANAFCAVRPPGHHAGRAAARGFCFLNNVAIGAEYARAVHGLTRVAIVDWDVHHGDGTQAIFWDDPGVLFFSTHQMPLFPGSGRRSERGGDAALGSTINAPLAAGATDTDLLQALQGELAPALARFQPQLILISAGFDGHVGESIAQWAISTEGYGRITRATLELARAHAGGRAVSVLEGGYAPEGLADCVEAHLTALLNAAT